MEARLAPGDVQTEVQREQWRLLLDNVRSSTLPTLLVGALFAGYFTRFADAPQTWIWWGVLAAVLATRWWLSAPHVAGREPAPSASWRLLASLVVSGLLWGIAPLMVQDVTDDIRLVMALLIPSGVALAAFGSFGIDPRAAYAVVLPIAAFNLLLIASLHNPLYYAAGVGLLLMYVHQALVMLKARRVLVNQIRLRVDNEQLNAELAAQADRTTTELERRMEMERQLRAARDRAERQSATDALTGIANRRYFDKRLKSEISRAFRERSQLSVVICDIDYFKQFNDTYGHQAGDECLKQFAHVLETYCRRGGDLVARIGGEEFALLLPTTEHANALRLAELTRAGFDGLNVEHLGSKLKPNATASFGVATLVPDNLDAGEQLMRQADRALYAAKRGGRNRVMSENDVALAASAT